MKTIIAALLTLTLTQVAFGADINVNCSAPKGFAGQSATIKGYLNIAPEEIEGYKVVSGKLKVTIGGSTRDPIYNQRMNVKGPALKDGIYQVISDEHPEVSMIFLDYLTGFTYVEMDGQFYRSECH